MQMAMAINNDGRRINSLVCVFPFGLKPRSSQRYRYLLVGQISEFVSTTGNGIQFRTTMQRKLVSVQGISRLDPIAGADFIERATVMGWHLVVKKGEFQEGDRCAFFEIDSMLPEAPWSEFMRSSQFRVRTKRMRGVLSQGLALPLSVVGVPHSAKVGTDITEFCGVTKYESPVSVQADIEGELPGFIPKNDEIRVQSAIGVLDELRGREVYATVKLDGMSATYAKAYGQFYVCSRNNQLKTSGSAYWQMAERYRLAELPEGYAVQGEICGEGVRKNRLRLKGLDFFVFSVFDIKKGQYLGMDAFMDFCHDHQLEWVPMVNIEGSYDSTDTGFDYSLEELLLVAEGFYEGTRNHREGIVIRPVEEAYSETLGSRLSIKVISNQYLVKGGE